MGKIDTTTFPQKGSSWHPEHKECLSSFILFSDKRQRDYMASVAHKQEGYLSHVKGSIDSCGQYYLRIYFSKD